MLSLFRPALAIFGAVLLVLAVLFLIPICLALIGEAPDWRAFLYSAIIGSITGVLLLFFNRESLSRLNPQRMFLITFTNWIGVSLFAALPFLLSDLGISFTDAVFESVSGITTTGSTVLSGLDAMPKDILLWRSITQWLGGIGIIGMAVAILPFLRIGGMRLFQTESSDWSDKAMPRARKLLVSLVVTYLLLSLLCMSAYALAGMGWFDAINHGMTTIATGGY
jgi:trk system potassium uptake protein TrkH